MSYIGLTRRDTLNLDIPIISDVLFEQLTTRLEQTAQELKNQKVQIKDLQSRPAESWRYHRTNEVLTIVPTKKTFHV